MARKHLSVTKLARTRATSASPARSAGRGTTSALAAVRGMAVDWESEILLYELTCQSAGQSGRTVLTRLCSIRSMARKLATSGPRQVRKADMVAYLAIDPEGLRGSRLDGQAGSRHPACQWPRPPAWRSWRRRRRGADARHSP